MPKTAELLLNELESAADDLLTRHGEHEGSCTNEQQMKLTQKVPPCKKHVAALENREKRFRLALENFKLMRGVFGTMGDV